MRIFVVNLEKDNLRREFIKTQFSKAQLHFEISNGVLGSALTTQQKLEVLNHKKAFRHLWRSLVPAEIGCALSHINIYKKIIDEDIEFACIFDDEMCHF